MNYNRSQLFVLVLLRWFIGWHFLYEGMVKLLSPSWSAKRYLMSSESFLDGFFTWLSSDAMIGIVNIMTVGLLLFVGITLIMGFWEKIGIAAGVALLTLFYLAHPSIPGFESTAPAEGSYLIVNKNLIELAALLVLWCFPSSKYFGFQSIFNTKGRVNYAA